MSRQSSFYSPSIYLSFSTQKYPLKIYSGIVGATSLIANASQCRRRSFPFDHCNLTLSRLLSAPTNSDDELSVRAVAFNGSLYCLLHRRSIVKSSIASPSSSLSFIWLVLLLILLLLLIAAFFAASLLSPLPQFAVARI